MPCEEHHGFRQPVPIYIWCQSPEGLVGVRQTHFYIICRHAPILTARRIDRHTSCMYARTHACTDAHKQARKQVRKHACKHACAHTHTCAHADTRASICAHMHTYVYIYIHVCIDVALYAFACACSPCVICMGFLFGIERYKIMFAYTSHPMRAACQPQLIYLFASLPQLQVQILGGVL